jgi:hypothetical protein
MVRLPRLTAAEAIALATALRTRAEARAELPRSIARELGRMRQRLDALRQGAETRVQVRSESDSKDEWNRALDAAWAALRWWCKGWALLRHPDHASQAASARKLEAVLFPDGLRFTLLPYREQWVESQARLGLVEKDGLTGIFVELGGLAFLDGVRMAHDDFGRALGLTEVAEPPPSGSILRDGRDELKASMRRYIMQVSAHADPEDPASIALADDLLLPVTTWQSRPATPPEAGEDAALAPALSAPAAGAPVSPER